LGRPRPDFCLRETKVYSTCLGGSLLPEAGLPAHSAETFLSLAWALVNLTLSSLARVTITFLFTNAILLSATDADAKSLNLPLGGGNVLGDLTSVGPVVHEEQFNVFHVSDQKFSEAAGEHVTGSLGLLATNLRHAHGSLESSSDGAINTSGFSPGFLQ